MGEEEGREVLKAEGSSPHHPCVTHTQFVAAGMFETSAPLTVTYNITVSGS